MSRLFMSRWNYDSQGRYCSLPCIEIKYLSLLLGMLSRELNGCVEQPSAGLMLSCATCCCTVWWCALKKTRGREGLVVTGQFVNNPRNAKWLFKLQASRSSKMYSGVKFLRGFFSLCVLKPLGSVALFHPHRGCKPALINFLLSNIQVLTCVSTITAALKSEDWLNNLFVYELEASTLNCC